MCDDIYLGNTQQTYREIMYVHFSNDQRLPQNRQKSDSFPNHFEQHFKSTTSCTDLRKCMTFKLVKHINSIGEIC